MTRHPQHPAESLQPRLAQRLHASMSRTSTSEWPTARSRAIPLRGHKHSWYRTQHHRISRFSHPSWHGNRRRAPAARLDQPIRSRRRRLVSPWTPSHHQPLQSRRRLSSKSLRTTNSPSRAKPKRHADVDACCKSKCANATSRGAALPASTRATRRTCQTMTAMLLQTKTTTTPQSLAQNSGQHRQLPPQRYLRFFRTWQMVIRQRQIREQHRPYRRVPN